MRGDLRLAISHRPQINNADLPYPMASLVVFLPLDVRAFRTADVIRKPHPCGFRSLRQGIKRLVKTDRCLEPNFILREEDDRVALPGPRAVILLARFWHAFGDAASAMLFWI